MSYPLFFKLHAGNKEDPFIYAETDSNGNIVPEPWDNGLEHRVAFSGLNIMCRQRGSKQFLQYYSVDKEKFDLYVTESRLIFKLRSLKKGLKFTGSLIDFAVDAIFKKSDDKEVEGLVMIGHLRYEWLISIMYFEKTSWLNDNKLRFTYVDNSGSLWLVTVTFPNDMDVRFLANEILHYACRYREKMTDNKSEEDLAFLEKYKTGDIPHGENIKDGFSSISIKGWRLAGSGSQYRPKL